MRFSARPHPFHSFPCASRYISGIICVIGKLKADRRTDDMAFALGGRGGSRTIEKLSFSAIGQRHFAQTAAPPFGSNFNARSSRP
jgi:hypothetical protein